MKTSKLILVLSVALILFNSCSSFDPTIKQKLYVTLKNNSKQSINMWIFNNDDEENHFNLKDFGFSPKTLVAPGESRIGVIEYAVTSEIEFAGSISFNVIVGTSFENSIEHEFYIYDRKKGEPLYANIQYNSDLTLQKY